MVVLFALIAQLANAYIGFSITRKIFSYLVLCNIILLLCLIGSVLNEIEIYGSHEASIYIVAFSFLLNLGAFFQNVLIGNKLRRVMDYAIGEDNSSPLANELDTRIIVSALLLFLMVAAIFFTRYGIPLFFDDLEYARRDVQKDAHIFYRFFLYFIPVSSAFLYARYKIYNSNKDKNLFRIFFLVAAIILLALGYKGFVLWYAVFVIMLINVYSDDVLKYSLVLGVVALLSGVVATIFMHSFTIAESLDFLLRRATQVAAYGYNIVFYELYPQLSYISVKGVNLNQFLAEWKFGMLNNMSIHSMGITTTIVGALMVSLGKAGALLAAILIGFVMQYVYFLAFKYKISPLFGVFYLYLTFTLVGVFPRGTIGSVFAQPVLSLFSLILFYIFLEVALKGSGKYVANKIKV